MAAATLFHQQTADDAEREAKDSQQYPAAGKLAPKHSVLAGGEHHHHTSKEPK